jgi:hypothetical protein
MANVAFTVTRSHAEDHYNVRVRLPADNDRLRPYGFSAIPWWYSMRRTS